MNSNSNETKFQTLISDFIGNIKSFGAYSASNLSFWHPLVTPSEYKLQQILHQHSEYDLFFKFYLMLKFRFGESLSDFSINYYMKLLSQNKFSSSVYDRNLLYLIELFLLIEKKQEITKIICQILEERIKKSTNDDTFPMPVFSAVYLLLTDEFEEIPSEFLIYIKDNFLKLQVFDNSKNKLLFSNFLSYGYDREILNEDEFCVMLKSMNYVPLSGTYNNFMQVVRLKYKVSYGSRSDGFIRKYNLKLLDNFSNCTDNDFAINGKFKIHNHWCGRNIVLKTLEILTKQPNLSTNIFEDTPESTLWFILRNLWHIENDTLEKDLTSEDLKQFSEATLLTFAFIAPSFAGLAEKTIGLPGLEQLALWNISHNSIEYTESPAYPYIKRSQNAIYEEISTLYCFSLEQHRYEKLEIGWFRDLLEIIGESKLKKLLNYLPLPFPEKRMRTREIAEMLLSGKMKTKDTAINIIAKYPFFNNQDELRNNINLILKYIGEVLVSSKAKKQKILPKIWAYLINTANYFEKIDISDLLLPQYIDIFQKPEAKIIKISTSTKASKMKSKKSKKENIYIDVDTTEFHKLKIRVRKNDKDMKRVTRAIKQHREYREMDYKINFLNEFIDKFSQEYESRIVKNRCSRASFWAKTKNTGLESFLTTMIFSVNEDFGLIECSDSGLMMNTVEGRQITIEPNDLMYLANPMQIHQSGKFIKCAEALVKRRIYQPTSQVFSEVCSKKECAKIINKWSTISFNQSVFNEALKKRGWNVNSIGNICKYDNINVLIVKIFTKNDSQFPYNSPINAIEDIQFFNKNTNKTLSYMDVDDSIINEIYDDLHLALSGSSITALNHSFSAMLQTFIKLYLESVGFKNVEFADTILSFVVPNTKKSIELTLDDIYPLSNNGICITQNELSDYTNASFDWNYYPHNVSPFWRIALRGLKAKILKVYPYFEA